MIYTAILTTHGNILKSKGKKPQYFNKLILELNCTTIKKIQGTYIHTIKEKEIIYILISKSKQEFITKNEIQDYFSDKLDFSTKSKKSKPKRNLNLKRITNYFLKLISKLKFKRKIKSKLELEDKLIRKNMDLESIKKLIDGMDDVDMNELRNRIRNMIMIYPIEELKCRIKKRKGFCIGLVGVNGVGKSTSLMKLAWYFKTSGFRVLIVACDSFRAGAVEQLKKHANEMELDVFDSGYGKDENAILNYVLGYSGRMNDSINNNENYNDNFENHNNCGIENDKKDNFTNHNNCGIENDKKGNFTNHNNCGIENDKKDNFTNHNNCGIDNDKKDIPCINDVNNKKDNFKNHNNCGINKKYNYNRNDYDIILVDTSGRMHTNKKLIDALKKMTKKMDHVIFCCEGLVGSDGLDQLKVFGEFSNSVFITKIDSCGDNVGTVIDIAQHLPVLFFGIGQNRVDISNECDWIVDSLLE